jgi:hypothetical protein
MIENRLARSCRSPWVTTLVACVATACGPAGPSLVFPADPHSIEVGVPRAQRGDRWSIGMETTICLDKPSIVEVTGVTPVKPYGLRVTGFGLRPNQYWKRTQGAPATFLGEERTPLRRLGFTGLTVDVACQPKTPMGYELAVRVLKTASGASGAAAWMVSYDNGDRVGTLEVPLAVVLCPAESADASGC